LDSDNIWFPDHLAAQMTLFEQNPELDLVYSDAFAWSDPRMPETFMDLCPSYGQATFTSLAVQQCQIPVSTVVARKKVIESAGLFDETLLQCDDFDMWLRVAFYGAEIGYTRKAQARLDRCRTGCLSASKVRMKETYCTILEKSDRALPLSQSQRACIRQRSAEIRVRYLLEEGKLELDAGHFREARELFAEANVQLRRSLLNIVQVALRVAPRLTRHAISLIQSTRKLMRRVARKVLEPTRLRPPRCSLESNLAAQRTHSHSR
jgi:GT2 family glycosyltransferase